MNRPADLPPIAAASPAGVTSQIDPELVALPAPPKRQRTWAALLMAFTAVVSCGMAWALRSEIAYAFTAPVPADVGDLGKADPAQVARAGSYVQAHGLLATHGAIRYSRPLEGDSFRLQQIAGNPRVWVEIRVPEGMEGPRFVPPTSFMGRLVPMDQAGLRLAGVEGAVSRQTGARVPQDAWVLVDGVSPRASRWAVAMGGLFLAFAMWNIVQIARILRPIRD